VIDVNNSVNSELFFDVTVSIDELESSVSLELLLIVSIYDFCIVVEGNNCKDEITLNPKLPFEVAVYIGDLDRSTRLELALTVDDVVFDTKLFLEVIVNEEGSLLLTVSDSDIADDANRPVELEYVTLNIELLCVVTINVSEPEGGA
jgi:hypothetical protein